MSWLDDLFGGSSTQPTPAAAPAQPPATYNDFLASQVAAAQAAEQAKPINGWSWLTGSGRDAATAAATAGAPAAWQAQQQGQQATQEGQLNLLRNLATASAVTGQSIDPSNIPASYGAAAGNPPQGQPPAPAPQPQPQQPPMPAPQSQGGGLPMPVGGQPLQPNQAPQGLPPAQPGSIFPRLASAAGSTGLPPVSAIPPNSPQPGQPPAPVGAGGPSMLAPQPAQPQGAPDPQQAVRAQSYRIGHMLLMSPQTAAAGADILKQIPTPDGATLMPDGSFVPTHMANGQTAQQYAAQGAGGIASAQAKAQVGPTNAEAAFKGNIDEAVHAANVGVDTANQSVSVAGADGKMHSVLRGQLPAGTAPVTGYDDNPYRAPQIKEIQDAQTAGSEAATQQNTVQVLGQALAKAPMTGPGAPTLVSAMQYADSLGLLGPEAKTALSNASLAKMSSVEVAGVLAKAISGGRTPLGIFNQIAAAKPGLITSEPGLMVGAINQDLQRVQDKAQFTTQYYAQNSNATKLDAQSAFDRQYPIAMYQSRVLPTPAPAPSARQVGYTYTNPAGAKAVWTGAGWSAQ